MKTFYLFIHLNRQASQKPYFKQKKDLLNLFIRTSSKSRKNVSEKIFVWAIILNIEKNLFYSLFSKADPKKEKCN
jgi:hypothetical protein